MTDNEGPAGRLNGHRGYICVAISGCIYIKAAFLYISHDGLLAEWGRPATGLEPWGVVEVEAQFHNQPAHINTDFLQYRNQTLKVFRW